MFCDQESSTNGTPMAYRFQQAIIYSKREIRRQCQGSESKQGRSYNLIKFTFSERSLRETRRMTVIPIAFPQAPIHVPLGNA